MKKPTNMKKERRKSKRISLNKKVSTNKSEHGMSECVLNISDHGCMLRTQQIYKLGEEILISINGGYKIGKVVWRKEAQYGLEFKTPERMLLELRNRLKSQEKEKICQLVKEGNTTKVLDFINNLLCTLVFACILKH